MYLCSVGYTNSDTRVELFAVSKDGKTGYYADNEGNVVTYPYPRWGYLPDKKETVIDWINRGMMEARLTTQSGFYITME